jgi:mannose/cellobiose epimerase-like protein (N-acyl-D-glucosamine 2-epimerase family)
MESDMKRIALWVFLLFAVSAAYAAGWETGQWQAKIDNDIATFSIKQITNDGLTVSLTWQDGAGKNIGDKLWAFTDDTQKYAQVELEDGTRYQLRITSFGDLITQRFVGESKKMAFLKPVPSDITRIEDYPTEQAIADLPNAETWQTYAREDLWSYWGSDEALGFTSYRCNNGDLIQLDNLCYELRQGWMVAGIENDYTRMLSRQVYTYGVLFNMTGEEDAFEAMTIGLEQLLARFEDNGSVKTILKDGDALYRPEQRTSQDLAYAQIGLAMGYYLTGDGALLDKLDQLKDHIIENYFREDWGMLAWTLEDQMPGDSGNQELVAQLDQLNAYMLLVYPHLPTSLKAEWESDIRLMVDVLLEKFHNQARNRFAGQLVKGQFNDPGDRHNDFGHSVKTYWMIYTAGQLLNDADYLEVGAWGIDQIIQQAIRFKTEPRGYSHWGNQVQSNGSAWWEFAELTQATATLALTNADYSRYLPDIYDMWFNNFVDQRFGGVFMSAGGGAKQNLWKNGYHEAEFGLIGYITSQKLKDEAVSLYFKRNEGHFQPYLYSLPVMQIESVETGYRVTF